MTNAQATRELTVQRPSLPLWQWMLVVASLLSAVVTGGLFYVHVNADGGECGYVAELLTGTPAGGPPKLTDEGMSQPDPVFERACAAQLVLVARPAVIAMHVSFALLVATILSFLWPFIRRQPVDPNRSTPANLNLGE